MSINPPDPGPPPYGGQQQPHAQPIYGQPQYGQQDYQQQQPGYGQHAYGQAGQPGYGPAGHPPPGQQAYNSNAPYGVDPKTGQPYSSKSKVVAGVLQLLLGGFGVGRFYTGHTGMAVGMLVVTLLTCGLGAIWGLIDGIMILVQGGTDAQGYPLRDS